MPDKSSDTAVFSCEKTVRALAARIFNKKNRTLIFYQNQRSVMVEAAGIEPASEKPLTELSPGAGHLLNFPGLAADARAA